MILNHSMKRLGRCKMPLCSNNNVAFLRVAAVSVCLGLLLVGADANSDSDRLIAAFQKPNSSSGAHPSAHIISQLKKTAVILHQSPSPNGNQPTHLLLNNNVNNTASSLHQPNYYQQQTAQLKQLVPEKVCIGTVNRLSAPVNREHHYQNLRDRYTNCTYIDGNLEITWLQNKSFDLSFLQSIREVTGYVLIAMVDVERIKFHSLSIIRGMDLFRTNNTDEYSLFIYSSKMRYMELPALQDILSGNVGNFDNFNLCHFNSIDWDNIIHDHNRYRVVTKTVYNQNECPPCHPNCNDQCWSDGQNMCQQMQHFTCDQSCSSKRCFGSLSNQCCHSFCVGGCTGPTERDCFACKNFNNDGECVQECPSMNRYNPTQFQWEPNPKGRYAHGSSCVEECPGHLLRDNGACVKKCPPNKRSQGDECISCAGPCRKECQGVDVVHSGNVEQLSGCTVIEGSITILDSSFNGYADIVNNSIGARHAAMSPSRLEALKTIREITGYLNIQANHPEFKDLAFLKNLEIIGGRQTTDMWSLSIIKTSLISLNLKSLKRVRAGGISIEDNRELCFAETVDWKQVNVSNKASIIIKNNGDSAKCKARGLQCHEQCATDGCFGAGQDECSSCKHYKFEDYCVSECKATQELGFLSYDLKTNKTCVRCHEECKDGCINSESRGCHRCKNVKDGPHCVAVCPSHKYSVRGSERCEECHKSCVDGCTGPSNKLGPGGCNSCGKAIINSTDAMIVSHCVGADESCPEGYYIEFVGPQKRTDSLVNLSIGKPICRRCHQRCKKCTGMGTHTSVCACARYIAGDQCEDLCPRDFYADEKTRRCMKCSSECIGCRGPSEAACLTCRAYRIYHGDILPSVQTDGEKSKLKFNCTDKCPPSKPYRISGVSMLDPYCSEKPDALSDSDKKDWWYGSTSLILMCLISATVMVCFSIYRCQMIEEDRTRKLTAFLSGFNDVEPLNPSNVKPNLAPMPCIKATELRKGSLLGSGFGGSVYEGWWYHEGNSKKSMPVAIKVLKDHGNSNMNKEFLEEAYTMSLANHTNLVRLFGVCMTSTELMLVTELIPLGCLLDHVIEHKNEIDAKTLLEWSKQIACGMAYLEGKRIVHRDLALRNVLLQHRKKAMIADFGLAKFLEINQTEYHSGEGRLPIKWLAPECLKERIFTHKSDVWAFGVTIWELLTFGCKPFEEYETEQVPAAIESGARLEQPSHVSAEVYKVMLACWVPNPEGRPNFVDLLQTFVNFARDPERYLIIGRNGRLSDDYHNARMLNHHGDLTERNEDEQFKDFNSDLASFLEEDPEESTTPLTPYSKYSNGDQRQFDFELRHHSESDTNQSQQSILNRRMTSVHGHTNGFIEEDSFSTAKQKVPSVPDVNNNNVKNSMIARRNQRINQNGSCWSMHQAPNGVRTIDQLNLATDIDDYLVPSPSNKEPEQFTAVYVAPYDRKIISTAPTTPITLRPPHSAGPFNVENEEYFVDRAVGDSSRGMKRTRGHFFPSSDAVYNNDKNKDDSNIHL